VNRRAELAALSRPGHLALRQVERQQALLERLHASRGKRVQLAELAHEFGVSQRTLARDVERLRLSGVPLTVQRGRGGGVSVVPSRSRLTIELDLPEAAALMSSLAVLGPTVTESAASAMRKLAYALSQGGDGKGTS
jgi:predicted DNA-binding transcriptional regulator YafY